jgi:hypothetical protein
VTTVNVEEDWLCMTEDMTHARCVEPVLLWGQPGEPDADTHMQAVDAHDAD